MRASTGSQCRSIVAAEASVAWAQAVHKSHGSVEDALEWCNGRVRQSGEQSIAVVESRQDERPYSVIRD